MANTPARIGRIDEALEMGLQARVIGSGHQASTMVFRIVPDSTYDIFWMKSTILTVRTHLMERQAALGQPAQTSRAPEQFQTPESNFAQK